MRIELHTGDRKVGDEIKNMAVAETQRGRGVGRALVTASIERDAFTPANGYPPGIEVDGIELRDRVWLDLRLDAG